MLQIFIKLIKLHVDFSDNFFFPNKYSFKGYATKHIRNGSFSQTSNLSQMWRDFVLCLK